MSDLITARGIDKHFAGVQALRDAEIAVRAGEVHALVGENGAGKSTLGKILAGVFRPDAGRILIDGQEASPQSPLQAQRLGISIIFQELDLFPNLTVAENIAIANLHFPERAVVSQNRLESFARPFLEEVGLAVSPRVSVGRLSMGQMQLVAIARALSMQARVIVMDEATSSLTDEAVDTLFGLIRRLKDNGVAIIYVSHKMDEIFRLTDRITVLRDGCYIGTRERQKTNVEEVIRMMVGREVSGTQRTPCHRREEVLLAAAEVATDAVRDVSFSLHAGEVLGIAGLVGSGRTEIGRALFGLDRLRSGQLRLRGQPIRPTSPRQAIDHGIGLLPEDRKLTGLMMQMSIRENATLSSLRACSRGSWLVGRREQLRFRGVAEQTRLKAASPTHAVQTLSGGNQQKVLLGRWLMVDPEVFFLDDPTRGVDVGAKEDIYGIIRGLSAAGKGIVMTSSELPELLRCCDRIMVMHDGRPAGTVEAAATNQEEIMRLATMAESPAAQRRAS